jgi:hypothetical protein
MFPLVASIVKQFKLAAVLEVKSAKTVAVLLEVVPSLFLLADKGAKVTGWSRVLVEGVVVALTSRCHGRAGSQQPTEPTEQPTVHWGQHRDGKFEPVVLATQ